MKKFFKDWSIFELLLLILSPITITTVAIIFKSDVLTTLTSIVGVLCGLCLAKGIVLGQVLGLAIVVLYSILSFKNAYYGEMLIYLFIMLPMYIWGLVGWIRNKNKETQSIQVNSIKLKEWIIVIICSIVIFIAFYFILKAMNTNQLFVSTLSVIDNVFAVYLLARRSKYGFVSYIVNDVLLMMLWGIPVIMGNILLLPMFFNPVVNFINDVYGVYNWTKMQKNQSKNN
jgi:nicotinamide mononucleotide transporter